MKIILAGGGSGGHITPILAVANELKKLQPDLQLIYIGQVGDSLSDIPAAHSAIDSVFAISAGKFRRYHGEGWKQLFDIKTQAKNSRDFFFVLMGIWQSYWLLKRLKPDLIFTRGGYVSVPVALAGKLLGIWYITHDSDSTPSLANKLIAPWACMHAVALPKELYPYQASKTVTVGVPVSSNYVPVTRELQASYKAELGVAADGQVILFTGGGNGARWLNEAALQCVPILLEQYPNVAVVHVTGRMQEEGVTQEYDQRISAGNRRRVIVRGFVTDLFRYSGAADIIVARGGATNLAEFAVQGKATVIIPTPQLIWNVKNAAALHERHAIVAISQEEASKQGVLLHELQGLLDDANARVSLGQSLAQFAHPDAARQLAMLLLEQAQKSTAKNSLRAQQK